MPRTVIPRPRTTNANLVRNGDFEYAPPFTAATVTNQRWIDGTAGGSTTNDLFGWAIATIAISAVAARFDPTQSPNAGLGSLKVSTTGVGEFIEVHKSRQDSAASRKGYGIPVLPNTSYTATYWMKTDLVSGTSNNGATCCFAEYTGDMVAVFTSIGAYVKTTTAWTKYTLTFTTAATTRFIMPQLRIYGHTGAADLILDAWFANITLTLAQPMQRLVTRDFKAALNFNGTSSTVALPKINPAAAVTFGLWVKLAKRGDYDLLSRPAGASTRLETSAAGQIKFSIDTSVSGLVTATGGSYTPGSYLFVVARYNGSAIQIFINGVSVATTPATGTVSQDTSQFWNIATLNGGAFTPMTVCHAFIATTALSDTQISNLYYGGITPSVAGYWKFDEGAGTAAADSSGNGQTVTLSSPLWTNDIPMRSRPIVNDNLVYNGDFEYAPPFTAATTTSDRWIDGTAAGSLTNNLFGWSFNKSGAASAQFDTSTQHSGTASLKISTLAAGSYIEVFLPLVSGGRAGYWGRTRLPSLPNKSYTYSYWLKTTVNSGAGDIGAKISFIESTGDGLSAAHQTDTTAVNATTGWTRYSGTFTTVATARYLQVNIIIYGHTGAGTLVMDAWFDDIDLRPTTAVTRLPA